MRRHLRTYSPSVIYLALCGSIILLASGLVATLRAENPKKEEKKAEPHALKGKDAQEVVDLKREVAALETLYHLELDEAQLKALAKLAEHTAGKPKASAEASAGKDYRTALRNFRDALAEADEEKVEELNEKLAEIHENEEIDIEEEFEITEAARKAAPAALKLLTPTQVISYLVAQEAEVPDPVERVILTLHEGEELSDNEWKEHRQEAADEIAWLVHGFDYKQAENTAKSIVALLDKGHAQKGEALKKESPNLEKAARNLVGGCTPTMIMEHYMQRELAEFLSNPQTSAALKARLQAENVDKNPAK
jgi:hypothetical protein